LHAEAETAAEKARREADEIRDRMQEALGRVAETRESARGLVVNLPDILFDSGRTTLRPEAKEVLSRVTGILLVTPGYKLSIEGHTDSTGSDRLNQELSEKRALAVHDYLAQAGFDAASMTTAGFGQSQPIAPNDTRDGRQRNRRTEIVILDANPAAAPPE
jgi:outer membrane protein OmpA-like peptidoglycan-associated protein